MRKLKKLFSRKLVMIIFFLGLILKPFYLRSSGSMQIGDLLIALSFCLLVLKDGKLRIKHDDLLLLMFVGGVIIVNITYGLIYQELYFIRVTSYYIFNLFVISVIRENHDQDSMQILSLACKINILVQMAIFLLDQGRWLGSYRYQGTFNDPNQLAFALFSWYLLIYCISRQSRDKYRMLYFALAFYLILRSGSMSMVLGMVIVFGADLIFGIQNVRSRTSRILYVIAASVALVFCFVILAMIYTDWKGGQLNNIEFFRRLTRKSQRSENGWFSNFIIDRNLTAVFRHPHVMLYGSGEGLMRRFSASGDNRELHSTVISLLFYYGIIPYTCLVLWVYRNLKGIDKLFIPPVIALVVESFTLINHRQPTFWIVFVIVGYCSESYNAARRAAEAPEEWDAPDPEKACL